jgi:hypothetical protein
MSSIQKYDQKQTVNDPRPDWMREFHDSTRRQTDQFKSSLTIDINKQLLYDSLVGEGQKAEKLIDAISQNTPFILYQDGQRFAVVIPKMKIITTFYPKDCTVEILDEKQFQNRVKMLYVAYPSFEYPTLKLLRDIITSVMTQLTPRLENPV